MRPSLELFRDVARKEQRGLARGTACIVAPSNNDHPIRVFVTSDDAAFRGMLSNLLIAHGYDVETMGGADRFARRVAADSDAAIDVVLRGPYDANKLLLIVRGVMAGRRIAAPSEATLVYGPLVLHSLMNTAAVAAREVQLTGVETRILRELMVAQSAPVARDRLVQCSMRRDSPPGDRGLDTHIKRLRRKIGPDRHGKTPIRTVRSVGYLLIEKWQPAT